MLRVSSALVAIALASAASADTATGSYTADFSTDQGNRFGLASHISSFQTLQLISDYSSDPKRGTWTTGALDLSNATGPISSFNASFKFAMQNNANGSWRSDGFSFLFGDMTDMSGTQWQGGEYGVDRFGTLNSGLAIGFDSYNNGDGTGVRAQWGSGTPIWAYYNQDFLDQVTYGFDNGSNGGGNGGSGMTAWETANNPYYMATAHISWASGGDLVVSIAFPSQSPIEYFRSSSFGSISVTEAFSFGMAARIGGDTWDVQIDDFNVSYSYEVPGPAAIAGLAGLGLARRRRQR